MRQTTSGQHPDVERVRDAMQERSESGPEGSDREPETPPEPAPETSEELDVEGPNESAPGHHPDPESEEE